MICIAIITFSDHRDIGRYAILDLDLPLYRTELQYHLEYPLTYADGNERGMR